MDDAYPLKYSKKYPFNRYTDYLQSVFGKRMQKVSIDAGFTCPNIDGNIGHGGCIYCNNASFNPNYHSEANDIFKQIDQGISKFIRRNPDIGYVAYFQSHTNTYGRIDELRELYEKAAEHPQIEGLIIATRPDCIGAEVLELLASINKKLFVGVEIGIESTNNATLKRINRRHTFEQTIDAIYRIKEAGLHLGGHVILGLPGETEVDILEHAKTLSNMPLDTMKLHQLQIIKNTALANLYRQSPETIPLFALEEYIDLCIRFAELLSPDMVIERFASESKTELLEVEVWQGVKNHQLADFITNEMKRRGTWQGRNFKAVRNCTEK
ncbi:MAG: TIGR01212 family radical SAM protein [Salinivirgaceae bacterium]